MNAARQIGQLPLDGRVGVAGRRDEIGIDVQLAQRVAAVVRKSGAIAQPVVRGSHLGQHHVVQKSRVLNIALQPVLPMGLIPRPEQQLIPGMLPGPGQVLAAVAGREARCIPPGSILGHLRRAEGQTIQYQAGHTLRRPTRQLYGDIGAGMGAEYHGPLDTQGRQRLACGIGIIGHRRCGRGEGLRLPVTGRIQRKQRVSIGQRQQVADDERGGLGADMKQHQRRTGASPAIVDLPVADADEVARDGHT